jgi:hypothetical protein
MLWTVPPATQSKTLRALGAQFDALAAIDHLRQYFCCVRLTDAGEKIKETFGFVARRPP